MADRVEPGPIVLFDGVCNLCNAVVRFIARRDPHERFRFASLQSQAARALLDACPPPHGGGETLVLIENGRCHTRSGAALRIARRLSMPWPLLAVMLAVPAPLRDAAYTVVARHRYRWFGRTEVCPLPPPGLARRLIE